MEISEMFEDAIKIEPKVVSIETLFNNEETLGNTKYDPEYQRNYVWDDEKATYFIESILLGTEIPPIVYFRSGEKIEIIDGRQRYQTILRFIRDEFKLRKSGLHKLSEIGIVSKSFKDIGELKDVFWDTKLRIIEFSFYIKSYNDEMEDRVKKEIFRRYNSGITPLKPTQIDKAYYLEDNLNSYIQGKLEKDKRLFSEISTLFYFEKNSIQILLKKIRQLLVQHKIPIKYYAAKKDGVISEYYEMLFSQINIEQTEEIFSSMIEKINILNIAQNEFNKKGFFFNRLVSECTFWALSVISAEDYQLKNIDKDFIIDFVNYVEKNKSAFEMDRSSFSKELQNRYMVTAKYFEENLQISFSNYINTSKEFKNKNKEKRSIVPTRIQETSFDDLRINKPEPSSITIVDICRQMERQRFLIRPPYQREEVINKNKSSAIIESILLGIKLPPIFVYKREDGVSEVLDGQQRLLSILGFLKNEYLDENNQKQKSAKHGYSLSLKNGILKNLDGLNVDNLDSELVKKIKNFDLWIIEINHRYNKDFEPIDLFLRLNRKPYPIKENTFEMWNSYINRNIIDKIKDIFKSNKDWFYVRKNDSRMTNENIYTALSYLEYESSNNKSISQPLEYYKVGNKINFRIRSKTEITKLLENPSLSEDFLIACDKLETIFIEKVKFITKTKDSENDDLLSKNLDAILNIYNRRRTQQGFYALWHFLSKIDMKAIQNSNTDLKRDLKYLFSSMNNIKSKSEFEKMIESFWSKYKQ
ncbi:DUF262 domain-containing protein [Bernardetia sp. Wsw4-3y2]|uniref:DUF262 domain-containing protein n=1 Tax=Bernardetia sp. Wsw4-3y2 TaxID=3127471 RepID=UPI0030D434AA